MSELNSRATIRGTGWSPGLLNYLVSLCCVRLAYVCLESTMGTCMTSWQWQHTRFFLAQCQPRASRLPKKKTRAVSKLAAVGSCRPLPTRALLFKHFMTCTVGADHSHSQWILHLVTSPLASSFRAKGTASSDPSPPHRRTTWTAMASPPARPSPRMHAVAPAGARESTAHVDTLPRSIEHIWARHEHDQHLFALISLFGAAEIA